MCEIWKLILQSYNIFSQKDNNELIFVPNILTDMGKRMEKQENE